MRSGTSFFNRTLYTKTMGRFWPLWVLYGVMWLFAIPLLQFKYYLDRVRYDIEGGAVRAREGLLEMAIDLPEYLSGGVWVAAFCAVITAMAVFGYLYNNRSAAMMHTLPLKRSCLFYTQYLAGLSFLVLPLVGVAGVTAAGYLLILPSAAWGQALSGLGLWLAVQCATSLFFFSFAAFCAMFTGHVLALPVFYGVLNGLALGLYGLISTLMGQFLYGLVGLGTPPKGVEWLTPAYKLTEACYWTNRVSYDDSGALVRSAEEALREPGTILIYALAGVLLAVAAALVNQVRHVESAGDVVAIPLVRPIFRWGVTFCVGLAFGIFTSVFFDMYEEAVAITAAVVLWSVVGYFVAQMFLHRSFRVLRYWKGCLAACGVILLLCVGLFADVLNIEGKVPAVERVQAVSVGGRIMGYPSDGAAQTVTLTDPAHIELVTNLHKIILREHEAGNLGDNGYPFPTDREMGEITVNLTYDLKGGGQLVRRYRYVLLDKSQLDQPGTLTWAANQLAQDREVVRRAYGLDKFDLEGWMAEMWTDGVYNAEKDRNCNAWISGVVDDTGNYSEVFLDGMAEEDLLGLWRAVQADFDAGTLGKRYLFDDQERRDNTCRADLAMESFKKNPNGTAQYETINITLTPRAEHTLAWLREHTGLGTKYLLATNSQMDSMTVGQLRQWFRENVEIAVTDPAQ